MVVETAGSLNAAQTGKNLVCARAHGVEPAAISSELSSKRSILCGEAEKCAVLDALRARLGEDGYDSIQAYVNRIDVPQLQGLRELVAADAGRPATFGWGPRVLHSTGQYHKGGPNTCVAFVITADDATQTEIPDARYSFSVLKRAQALGDVEALRAHQRRVVRVHLASAADPERVGRPSAPISPRMN